MEACPYCLEEIREGAVKCRYCGSLLKSGRSSASTAKGSEPGSILYNVDRDFVRFARYAVWCLLACIALLAILYLYGFHTGRIPAKPEQVTYTFLIDGELYRFIKVAGAILAIFATVGVFLYGFEIKKAAKEARDSADSTRQARFDVAKIKDDMQADQEEAQQLLQQVKMLITSSKEEISRMAGDVAADREKSRTILGEVQKAQETIEQSRNQARSAAEQVQASLLSAIKGETAIIQIRAQLERSDSTRARQDWDEGFFTVPQLVRLYEFPSEYDGQGQCIGLIELGGGYLQSDLESYFEELKIPLPSVQFVSVDGAENQARQLASQQVTLDIETAGAAAPGARFVVYMAPNTSQGFVNAITTACRDEKNRPSILSIAWGGPESSWDAASHQALNEALASAARRGITVLCASGDGGVTDGVADGERHIDFPASSPWALACGGTRVKRAGNRIARETVWNDPGEAATGGGVSRIFARPDWQSGVDAPLNPLGKSGRAIPDVAAHASTHPGYFVVFNGNKVVVGGTSASTPLWAGLIARLNQALGKNLGFFNPVLYQKIGPLGAFRDITLGDNGMKNVEGYGARPGWDLCTGWGSPNGKKLLDALRSSLDSTQPSATGPSSAAH